MADSGADRLGQRVGPYRLIRLLGAGGFGAVYEADHQLLEQKRAIKLLLERHFHNSNQRERFLREARTLATLEHPNIVPVLEVGEEDDVLYLVMPFYRQGTLKALLKNRTTPLPLDEVERFFVQICAAVGYAHARHVAHLDLKPDNMLIHEGGRLILSDFGLAHLIKQGRLEAGSSARWGTPHYMAPEQIQGKPELRSDIYALGVILYQLLTNLRPFTGDAPEAVMMKHLQEAPPPLCAASPAAPISLEPVVRKALEKKPEERYATAEALLADFRAAVNSLSWQVAQSPSPITSHVAPLARRTSVMPLLQKTKEQWIAEGLIHLQKPSQTNEALEAFEQALRFHPMDVIANFGKGYALWVLGRIEEALIIYEQALPFAPTDAPGFYLKGCALYYLQRYLEALTNFEQALRLSPTYAPAWSGKGAVFYALQQQKKALDAYNQATQLDPNYVRAWLHKGGMLEGLKHYEEALVAYDRANHLDPNSAETWLHKGRMLGELKRYEEALVAYERAIQLDPNSGWAWNNKGWVLGMLRRYEEALIACERAIQLDFTNHVAWLNKEWVLGELRKKMALGN